jgi:hypothetical protein
LTRALNPYAQHFTGKRRPCLPNPVGPEEREAWSLGKRAMREQGAEKEGIPHKKGGWMSNIEILDRLPRVFRNQLIRYQLGMESF